MRVYGMPKNSVGICLVEEYLASSDCYLAFSVAVNYLKKELASSHFARFTLSLKLRSGTLATLHNFKWHSSAVVNERHPYYVCIS